MATTTEMRQFITDMVDGLVVTHDDYTPDDEATAEATVRLRHLANLDDEELRRTPDR